MTPDALRLFVPATISFLIGIGLTPFLTHFLYKHRLWKPTSGKKALDGSQAETFNQLHKNRDTGVPRFGGVIVWGSVLLTAGLISLLGFLSPSAFGELSFISRSQTWVPLAALVVGALVGLLDDTFEVQGRRGLPLRVRLVIIATVSLLCALWFYHKLGVSSVSFPFITVPLQLGVWFVPFFMLTAMVLYAGGVIDGSDFVHVGGLFRGIQERRRREP